MQHHNMTALVDGAKGSKRAVAKSRFACTRYPFLFDFTDRSPTSVNPSGFSDTKRPTATLGHFPLLLHTLRWSESAHVRFGLGSEVEYLASVRIAARAGDG